MTNNTSNRNKGCGFELGAKGGNSGLWTGIVILLVGVAALLRVTTNDLPDWLFTWPMLLVVIGMVSGISSGFRGSSWFIMLLVGGVFLTGKIIPDLEMRRYLWPIAIIAVGLYLILRPRENFWGKGFMGDKRSSGSGNIEDATVVDETTFSKEDFIESTTVFGGINKSIVSKNFKGGNIVVLFGGSEINFNQEDMQSSATLNFNIIFGGTKIIVPSNWAIKTELTPIFGGIEDKRTYNQTTGTPEKILVLKGTVIFGGIDIRSY